MLKRSIYYKFVWIYFFKELNFKIFISHINNNVLTNINIILQKKKSLLKK